VGSARIGSRSVALGGAGLSLTAAHARTIELSLTPAALKRLEAGASPGSTAAAVISVSAGAPGQAPSSWTARVRLTLG
jgi:hypothetical protein